MTYEDKLLTYQEGTVGAMQLLHEKAMEEFSTNVDLWEKASR